MSNNTNRILILRKKNENSQQYVGKSGEIFYDPEFPELKLSDGSTPGGISIGGTGGGGGGSGAFSYCCTNNITSSCLTSHPDITTACHNFFAGVGAGCSITSGNYNNFFGRYAGRCNTTGGYNNFFGRCAGYCNNTGYHNNFLGDSAGCYNTAGCFNNFFGFIAGRFNTCGNYNNFFGRRAGGSNTAGCYNNFFGRYSGSYNTTGSCNNFLGSYAGLNNINGNDNIFFGTATGISTSASRKVILGSGYNFNDLFDSPDTTKDTQFAVGVRTDANPANYWLVGNENFNVGIGTTNPQYKLDVGGIVRADSFVGDGSGLVGVIGTGNGVEIQDDGSPVGTAATINFGSNLNVTFGSGVATIDAVGGGGGGESQWVTTNAGIHTLSNVGVGTTNPLTSLNIFSDSSPTLSITHTFASTIIRGFYFVNDPSSNNLDIRRYFNGFQTALLAISNNGDVTPAGNDNNLLGSGSERWKNIYSNIFTVGIGATIGSPTNNVLTLGTNSSEGMRINASNNVGIGTTNPQYKLDVGGDINLTGTVYRNGSPIAIGRTTITQTTGTLGIGSTANITFTNGIPKYALLKASTSSGAWVTLYTDSASRTSDASRSIDTDPTPGSGVIAEMISTGTGITTQRFTPGVIGYNDDEPVSNNIYVKVYNNSGISTDITVTLTISE